MRKSSSLSVFGVTLSSNYCQGWGFDANWPCELHLCVILVDSVISLLMESELKLSTSCPDS